jgi:hypothetical protein
MKTTRHLEEQEKTERRNGSTLASGTVGDQNCCHHRFVGIASAIQDLT